MSIAPFSFGNTVLPYLCPMKFSFWSIGKNHEAYIQTGLNEFTRRINRYHKTEWNLIAPPRNAASLPEEALKKKEAGLVLQALQKDDYLIALDEYGKQLSSDQLAKFLQERANESVKNIVFLIGGAYGLDESLLRRADFRWSLSSLTFPHQLVRLILAEQVYRACTILKNEKYHHGSRQ